MEDLVDNWIAEISCEKCAFLTDRITFDFGMSSFPWGVESLSPIKFWIKRVESQPLESSSPLASSSRMDVISWM